MVQYWRGNKATGREVQCRIFIKIFWSLHSKTTYRIQKWGEKIWHSSPEGLITGQIASTAYIRGRFLFLLIYRGDTAPHELKLGRNSGPKDRCFTWLLFLFKFPLTESLFYWWIFLLQFPLMMLPSCSTTAMSLNLSDFVHHPTRCICISSPA